jgi:signal transduction histidine kinase
MFTDGLFLVDLHGSVLLTYPYRESGMVNLLSISHVAKAVTERKPVISNVYTEETTGRKVVFALVPLKNRDGEVVGAVGGAVNPTNSIMSRVLQTVQAEAAGHYIEVIDSNEIVVASDKPVRILEHHDHGGALGKMIKDRKAGIKTCPHGFSQTRPGGGTQDILAFVPLQTVPWGVIFGQSEKEILAPAKQLTRNFALLAVIFIGSAILFGIGVTKNIVSPIRSLTTAANRIAGGDLSASVDVIGTDEIAVLARSFGVMRHRLADSLQSIQLYSVGLEQRVYERTIQLEEKQKQNESLLKKLITSQEDERKRVARDLHDESLQTLSAILMNIEMCRLHPELITPDKVSTIKETVTRVINEVNKVVQNLRPTVLDDLGFEAAMVWLVDSNLRDRGIHCHLNMDKFSDEKLTPHMEITLFRIIQEATSNIARHAKAKNAFIEIKTDEQSFSMSIEDDGEGFDIQNAFQDMLTGRGLGILGMKERASLVNGTLTVCSTPGEGTTVVCKIPLS